MKTEYAPLEFGGMNEYLKRLHETNCCASDYSFANIWGWGPHYGLEWRFDGDLCWLRQTKHAPCEKGINWAPVGSWERVEDWSAKPEMQAGALFTRVPEELCLLWEAAMPGRIKKEEARGQWDYVYSSTELATLSGNRFHKKKNLVKQFERNYNYAYEKLTSEGVEDVLELQHEWCKWRDCESSETLFAENEAVTRVLMHFDEIPGLCGGLVRIDNELVAYTVGEPITEDTLIVHFEKAANTIKGGYQAINYLFCSDVSSSYAFVNREQDIDDEGLRQAKLSYNPVDFVKKYNVTIL